MNRTVAICIPCYENIVALGKLLDSIFNQDYKKYIIVISDDSKSDVVRNMIASLNNKKIIYNKNKVPLGATRNCNQVMRMARKLLPLNAGYIKLMHHDDFFTYSYSLGKMVNYMEANKDAMFMFCKTLQVRGEESWNTFRTNRHYKRFNKDKYELYRVNCIGAPSATMFRNVDKFQFFDNNLMYLVDIELYMRILENGKGVFWAEPLISIGEYDTQLTYKCLENKKLLKDEYCYVYNKVHGLHKAKYKKILRKKLLDNETLSDCIKINLLYLEDRMLELLHKDI